MPSASILEKNLEKFSKIFTPQQAKRILNQKTTNLSFCLTKNEELNLEIEYQGKKDYLHSQENALKEACEWFSSLNLNNIQVLYIYGVGLGYYYDAAESWLRKSPEHYLTFLEDRREILYKLFESERGSLLLEDPQVYLYDIQCPKERQQTIAKISYFFAPLQAEFSSLKYYKRAKMQKCLEIETHTLTQSIESSTIASEYLQGGVHFYQNFYHNILRLRHTHQGSLLFNKFKNIPAIVCGSGPSLQQHLPSLPSLKSKALVLSSGSATKILSSHNIHPHIAVCVDPTPEQYQNLSGHNAFECPFFYHPRLYFQALREIHGPRLLLNSPKNYPLIEWLEKLLSLNTIDLEKGGTSTSNFCLSLAHLMGCNPIIFLGLDLSYVEKNKYAPGLKNNSFEENLSTPSHTWWGTTKGQDKHGKSITTAWNWLSEASWFEVFSQKHPDITLINASENSLLLKNIPNIPLKEVENIHLKNTYDIRNRLHSEIFQYHPIKFDKKHIFNKLHILYDSLLRCISLCEEKLDEIISIEEYLLKKMFSEEQVLSLEKIFQTSKVQKEDAFQYVLLAPYEFYARTLARNLHRINREKGKKTTKQYLLDRISLEAEGTLFIIKTAEMNLDIMERAIQDYEHEMGELKADI